MKAELMTNYDVVRKLIGPIHPVGESHTDHDRYKNLGAMTQLVDKLMFDLHQVARSLRPEASIQKAAKHASEFIDEIKAAD